MGVMPVNRLLISMSLPMMISMLVQALYNIVDSIFVSRIAETAVRAVSLSFPLQSLMIAIASGSAVGVNALLSRSLGEKNYEKVNKVAGNGIFMVILCYLLFVLIGLFAVRPFMYSQTGVESVRNYGVSYLTICCVCSAGMFTQMIFERLLQSTGKTFYTMITQGTGAVINIILDPILIFGYFGMPRMGIAGAAVATVIGQIIAAILALVFNLKCNRELNISMNGFRPNGHLIVQI